MKSRELINIDTGMYCMNRAKEVLKLLRDGEECGWTYELVHLPNAWARIDAFDEEGELVVEGMIFDDGSPKVIFPN